MDLKKYFDDTMGTGVLATSDSEGKVDVAIYAKPHILDDGSMAMIMRDRLTHHNLLSNPHAAYLFKEEGRGYKGKRFFLTKIREEEDSDLLIKLKRRNISSEKDAEKGAKFLAIFKIDKELPIIGPENE